MDKLISRSIKIIYLLISLTFFTFLLFLNFSTFSLQSNSEAKAIENAIFPNPFSDQVNFKFSIDEDAEIYASIYDAAGKLVAELIRKDAK